MLDEEFESEFLDIFGQIFLLGLSRCRHQGGGALQCDQIHQCGVARTANNVRRCLQQRLQGGAVKVVNQRYLPGSTGVVCGWSAAYDEVWPVCGTQ